MKRELKAGIQRYIEDVAPKVPYRFIAAFGHHNSAVIASALKEWAASGQLKIVCPPEECAPDDICVELTVPELK